MNGPGRQCRAGCGAWSRRHALAALVGLAALAAPGAPGVRAAAAQQAVRVEVRDDAGATVGFALVAPVGGASRVASDAGVAEFRLRAADSLHLRVRRIGYREFQGWVPRTDVGTYAVRLERLAATLQAVQVTAAGASVNTPLAQRGFYDRVDRVQKGAILADFFTPEQLDERPFTKISQMIAGSRYARVGSIAFNNNRRLLVIVSRGGCPMTILLDGQPVIGTAQDIAVSETPQSLAPAGTRQSRAATTDAFQPPTIDDVIDGRAVSAIEVYPSMANAPQELVRGSGRGSCGIVALWTGARR
ncbi:MAG: hypothetical protein K1X31_09475 [Gemmatimonadaceae bacterium]|nr:hypothetical protein [Gemmatimonadaceae bacterium]